MRFNHIQICLHRLLILNHDIKGKHDLVYLALPARTLNRRKDPVYKTNDMMVLKGEYEATKRKKKKKTSSTWPPLSGSARIPFSPAQGADSFCLANSRSSFQVYLYLGKLGIRNTMSVDVSLNEQ